MRPVVRDALQPRRAEAGILHDRVAVIPADEFVAYHPRKRRVHIYVIVNTNNQSELMMLVKDFVRGCEF